MELERNDDEVIRGLYCFRSLDFGVCHLGAGHLLCMQLLAGVENVGGGPACALCGRRWRSYVMPGT